MPEDEDMPDERTPSVAELSRIIQAAASLLQKAWQNYLIAGEPDPPGFPVDSRIPDMLLGVGDLEKAINPKGLPFTAPARKSLAVVGWPDVNGLFGALQHLRALQDIILQTWQLEPLCEGRAIIFQSEGVQSSGLDDDIAVITVTKGWPPKIDRAVWEALGTATGRLIEVVRSVGAIDSFPGDQAPRPGPKEPPAAAVAGPPAPGAQTAGVPAKLTAVAPPRELSGTERRILTHCRRKAHKGERIAHHVGLSNDHTRRILARLVKERRLRKTDAGYRTV
jgi:hypothetical protein